MADVINETMDDVVYQVDDGGGPGGDELRHKARATKTKKICNKKIAICAGWLTKASDTAGGNEVYGVYPGKKSLCTVSFWEAQEDDIIDIKYGVPRDATVRLRTSGIQVD